MPTFIFARLPALFLCFIRTRAAFAGNGTPDVHKILGGVKTRRYDYTYNDIKDAENPENLYIGRSGDPWNESSRNYEEDMHLRVSSITTTKNNTKAQSVA